MCDEIYESTDFRIDEFEDPALNPTIRKFVNPSMSWI